MTLRSQSDPQAQLELESKADAIAYFAKKVIHDGRPGTYLTASQCKYGFALLVFRTDGPELAFRSPELSAKEAAEMLLELVQKVGA